MRRRRGHAGARATASTTYATCDPGCRRCWPNCRAHRRAGRPVPGGRRRPCSGCSSSTRHRRWRPYGNINEATEPARPSPQQPAAGPGIGGGGRGRRRTPSRCPRNRWVPPPHAGAPRTAVLAAGAAQEAVGQAQTLLDAVERTDTDLAAAVGQLAAACAAVDQELAPAARSGRRRVRTEGSLRAQLDQIQAMLGWPVRRRGRPTR